MNTETERVGIEEQPTQTSAAEAIAPAGSKRIIVHLVHGTWPEGPLMAALRCVRKSLPYPPIEGEQYWFQTRHPFRLELERQLRADGLKPDIRAFIWSGANSFRARASAAEEFVPHLARGIRDETRQIVVAHSHGGTLAMLALKLISEGATPNTITQYGILQWLPCRRKSARERELDVKEVVDLPIERAQAGARQIELVTMATPFLRVERFGSGKFLWNVFAVCWMTAYCALAVWAVRRYGQNLVYPIMFAVTIAAALLARPIQRSREFVQHRIIDTQSCVFPGKRIQCIRGIADEAELGISMGIIGCNLIRTLLVGFGQRLSHVSVFLIGLSYCGAVGALTYAVLADKADPFVGWIYLLGFAAVGLVMLLAIASLLQSVLGIELAWAGFGFLTTVESSPDAALRKIEVVTLPATQDTAEGIRHAVYLHPECVPRIVAGLGL